MILHSLFCNIDTKINEEENWGKWQEDYEHKMWDEWERMEKKEREGYRIHNEVGGIAKEGQVSIFQYNNSLRNKVV